MAMYWLHRSSLVPVDGTNTPKITSMSTDSRDVQEATVATVATVATEVTPALRNGKPFRSSFPLTSRPPPTIYHPYAYDDDNKRNFRASLPTKPVPEGYWDFQMDSPRQQRRRQNSLASSSVSTNRSSVESRFDRSVSYGSAGTSTRTSIDSACSSPHPLGIPSRPDIMPRAGKVNTRTSLDSVSPNPHPLNIASRAHLPSRAASSNGEYPGEVVTPRPIALLRPQRLAPLIPRLKNTPGEAFSKLPEEALTVVLAELRKLHLESRVESETCATCWMRDACSLSATSRKWAAAARPRLYENIWLVGPESLLHIKKKFKMKSGTRLKLLGRTLRENPILSEYVRSLKVPDVPDTATTKKERDGYLDIVASVIMSCPNLERLSGLYPAYNHEFSGLVHALSTRTKLVEHVWNITASPYQRQYRLATDDSPSIHNLVPGPLYAQEAADFLSCHANWPNLTTLALHCNPGGTIDPSLLLRTISQLPSLTDLALSAIPTTPSNLLVSLPPLKSLHLARLPSVKSHHLSTFATCPAARMLTSLSLIDINLTSLPVLARLLLNLTSLQRLNITQDTAPSLPTGTSIFLHPYLASASLRDFIWDILSPNEEDHLGDATMILAKAIHAGGFPALRMLKAPCDYDGVLQSLCRPAERVSSLYESGAWKGATGTLIDLIDEQRKDSGVEVSDSGYGSSSVYGYEYTRSLRAARLAAQSRIETARSRPKIKIIVEDWADCENGNVTETGRFDAGAYIGMVRSRIKYCLEPDVEGKDESGVRIEDVINSGEGKFMGRKGTCDGRWNMTMAGGKGGWKHMERVRWKPLEVRGLF